MTAGTFCAGLRGQSESQDKIDSVSVTERLVIF
jgi:hypothetical protein